MMTTREGCNPGYLSPEEAREARAWLVEAVSQRWIVAPTADLVPGIARWYDGGVAEFKRNTTALAVGGIK